VSEPSLALQKALRDRLIGATAAGPNVFDRVPTADPYPRVTIGEVQILDDSTDCTVGFEAFADVHVWSRGVGFVEAKTIGGEVHGLLHDHDLPVAGFHLVECVLRDARYLRDPDGITSHGVFTFAITVETDG